MNTQPRVVAQRGGLRLVHSARDAERWPNVSDLVLERLDKDAMGQETWNHVTGWCLSAASLSNVVRGEGFAAEIVALKMLLDDGPVLK